MMVDVSPPQSEISIVEQAVVKEAVRRAQPTKPLAKSPQPPTLVSSKVPYHPAELVAAWGKQGKLPRLATGFETLDDACGGGLAVPWRVVVVGAPSAGKTFFSMVTARRMVDLGNVFVGILAVDEEPDDLTVRLAQLAGYSVDDCETREPMILEQIQEALEPLPIRLYGPDWTVEAAGTNLASLVPKGHHGVFVADSAQTIKSEGSLASKTKRDAVVANVTAIREVTSKHRFLTIVTSEAGRGQYANEKSSQDANRMAGAKESGDIEFMAQTLIYLGTPRGLPHYVYAECPKNRRGKRGSFEWWMRFDRQRHQLTECDPPAGKSDNKAAMRKDAPDRIKDLEQIAERVLQLVLRQPGLSTDSYREMAPKMRKQTWNAVWSLLKGDGGRPPRIANRTGKTTSPEWIGISHEVEK